MVQDYGEPCSKKSPPIGVTSLPLMKIGLTDQPTNQPTDQPTYGRTQGMLHFQLSSICLKAEATKLNEAGVKILIALGHSGYDIEQVVEQPNK